MVAVVFRSWWKCKQTWTRSILVIVSGKNKQTKKTHEQWHFRTTSQPGHLCAAQLVELDRGAFLAIPLLMEWCAEHRRVSHVNTLPGADYSCPTSDLCLRSLPWLFFPNKSTPAWNWICMWQHDVVFCSTVCVYIRNVWTVFLLYSSHHGLPVWLESAGWHDVHWNSAGLLTGRCVCSDS